MSHLIGSSDIELARHALRQSGSGSPTHPPTEQRRSRAATGLGGQADHAQQVCGTARARGPNCKSHGVSRRSSVADRRVTLVAGTAQHRHDSRAHATRGSSWTGPTTSGRRSAACCQTPRSWRRPWRPSSASRSMMSARASSSARIALNGQLGPEAAAAAAIEAELGRLQSVKGTRPPGRPIAADSLDDLLAETRALEAEGSLDLETIVAIQRASGAIAARTDRPPGRPAAPLRGHPAPDLGALRRRDAGGPAGPRPSSRGSAASSSSGTS